MKYLAISWRFCIKYFAIDKSLYKIFRENLLSLYKIFCNKLESLYEILCDSLESLYKIF
jgi:hypothetical protein